MEQVCAPRGDRGAAAEPSAQEAAARAREEASVRRERGDASLYVVQAGDTLAGIAAAHGLSVLDLLEANPGVGGNLACLRSSGAWTQAATAGARSNAPLERFLGTLRWYWLLRGCFRRRDGGAAREQALLDAAQAELAAAGKGLVEDIVRRASAVEAPAASQVFGTRRRDAPRGGPPE